MKGDFIDAAEPWAIFRAWMAEAEAAEPNDPTAMSLATVDPDGLPNVRMVLLKGANERGARLPLEEPAPPDPRPRAGDAGERGRGRRLFREPPARQPHRRLGEPAV